MRSIVRIYNDIFKLAPFSAIITILHFIANAAAPAFVTIVFAEIFDAAEKVLNNGSSNNELYFYAILYLAVRFGMDLLNYLFSVTVNTGVFEKGTMHFRIALYEKAAKLPLILYEDAELLNCKQRAEQAVDDEILPMIFYQSLEVMSSAAATLSVAIVLTQYSIWLFPLAFLSVLPFLAARLVRGKEFFHVKSAQAKKTRLLSYLWGLFTTKQSMKEMRVMGFDHYITNKWHETRDEVNEEIWTVEKKEAISLMLCDGFRILGYGASIAIVLLLVAKGDVRLGVLGASITAFLSLQNTMKSFLISFGQMPEMILFAKNYYSFLDRKNEHDGTTVFTGLQKEIVLKNVTFSYPNSNKPALDGINLVIKKGEKVAILGENGSGKTTLAKVLLGLYPVDKGSVLYDGTPAADFTGDSFYKRVTAIAQDYASYSLTLRENVALSDVSRLHNDIDIRAALQNAGVEKIGELDDMMGREFSGLELSSGQWQRLAIARGLFKNSEIILLDEPTSSLDPLIETEILTKFVEVAKDKTALLISHRVGLCKLVDKIIVLKDGKVVEIGTHDSLLDAGRVYAHLYQSQEFWYIA